MHFTRQDDDVVLVSDQHVDLVEHNLVHPELHHDLSTKRRTCTLTAQQRVDHVDQRDTLVVEEHGTPTVSRAVPDELDTGDASRRNRVVRTHRQVLEATQDLTQQRIARVRILREGSEGDTEMRHSVTVRTHHPKGVDVRFSVQNRCCLMRHITLLLTCLAHYRCRNISIEYTIPLFSYLVNSTNTLTFYI